MKPLTVIHLVILFTIMLPTTVLCENTGTMHAPPDNEKRSCIQEADGYAYLSEDMTLSQTRAAAFTNARRQAVEAAGTYIKTRTTVKDFVAEDDLIWSDAEGSVRILDQKDYGVKDNTRYHVWIKAEVEYHVNPEKQCPDTTFLSDGLLTVNVWTPEKSYTGDDLISIFIMGNRDFYARIVNIAPDGEIIQLLPNDYRQLNYFNGRQVYKIPDAGDRFELKATPPFGEDRIVVYASEVPLGCIETEHIGLGLRKYKGSRANLDLQARKISVVSKGREKNPGAEFYEAEWTIYTRR